MPTHYDVLGVAKDADDVTIKKAYLKLAFKYHPDKNPTGEEQFKVVSAAHKVLSDPNLRKAYDTSLQPPSDRIFHYSDSRDSYAGFNYPPFFTPRGTNDFFNMYFGFTPSTSAFNLHEEVKRRAEAQARQAAEAERIKKEREAREAPYKNADNDYTHVEKNNPEYDRVSEVRKTQAWYTETQRISKPAYVSDRTWLSFKKNRSTMEKLHFGPSVKRFARKSVSFFTDTARPFKAYWGNASQARQDFFTPLLLILSSAVGLLGAVFVLPFKLVYDLFSLLLGSKGSSIDLGIYRETLETLVNLVAGILMFTLNFIKLPIRGLMTWVKGKEVAEESFHYQRITKEAREAITLCDKASARILIELIHTKFTHALQEKKCVSKIDVQQETLRYAAFEKHCIFGTLNKDSALEMSAKQKEDLTHYLGLFEPESNFTP